jgi:glycosyltransferase involved in cell wall biosynthesis
MGETEFIVNAHKQLGYFTNADTINLLGALDGVPGATPRKREQGSPLRVGFLGELSELKAPDLIAKASHLVGDRNITYHLGGKSIGEYADTIPEMFKPGTAEFYGWTKPDEFFPKVDVLILPSRGSEVFGRVITEAYSYGMPAIGSSKGGIPESVEHGKSGFVFTSNDHEELAGYISQLHDDVDLYNAMAERALEKARLQTYDRWATDMTAWFEKIVGDYRSAKTAA